VVSLDELPELFADLADIKGRQRGKRSRYLLMLGLRAERGGFELENRSIDGRLMSLSAVAVAGAASAAHSSPASPASSVEKSRPEEPKKNNQVSLYSLQLLGIVSADKTAEVLPNPTGTSKAA